MTYTHTLKRAAVGASAALLLAACAASPEDSVAPASTPPATSAPAVEPSVTAPEPSPDSPSPAAEAPVAIPEALQFEAPLLTGEGVFDGESLAGQDALIWVWAPWCPVCQAEAPEVAAAAADLPEGVALYGLPGKADAASSQAFVEEHGLGDFPHIFSEDGSVWERFGITYQPALVLIGSDGSVEAIPGATGTQGILDAAQELADS